jgi:hypothetical protein
MATNTPGFIFNEEPNSPNSKVSAVNLNNLISKATIYNIGQNAVTCAHIDPSVAGEGLSGGNGMPLSVQVDGKTLEISNALKIKSSGVKTDNIADEAITKNKLSADLQKLLDDAVKNALHRIYQRGDFFITRNATFNPADRFGGEWELVKDRFLVGAGEEFILAKQGGNSKTTLQVSDLPYHRHGIGQIARSTSDYAGGLAVLGTDIDISSLPVGTKQWNDGRYDLGYDRKLSTKSTKSSMNMMSAGIQSDPLENYEQTEVDNTPPWEAVNIWVKISD